jgi:hypothetical protein
MKLLTENEVDRYDVMDPMSYNYTESGQLQFGLIAEYSMPEVLLYETRAGGTASSTSCSTHCRRHRQIVSRSVLRCSRWSLQLRRLRVGLLRSAWHDSRRGCPIGH